MARTTKPLLTDDQDESIVRVFFRGFFLPLRLVGRGLAWTTHKPPLKQIGHGLRWFGRLRAVQFVALITGVRYVHSSFSELKEVTWPTRREGLRLTSAVIMFSVVFGALIAVVDYGLDKVFKQLLLK